MENTLLEKILNELETRKVQFSPYTKPLITFDDVENIIKEYTNTYVCVTKEQALEIDKTYSEMCKILTKYKEELSQQWIPVTDHLPKKRMRVLAKIKYHEWISNYWDNWVSEEEKVKYPECVETCEARYCGEDIGWEFYNMQNEGFVCHAYVSPSMDISFPVYEVIAWRTMPE